jgi:hypothetical protein
MRRAGLLVVVLLLLGPLLAACNEDQPAQAPPQPDLTDLEIEVTGVQDDPLSFGYRCGAGNPCTDAEIDAIAAVIASAREEGRACTQQYGGPEKARVTGRLRGQQLDIVIDRTDGCGIGDYQALFDAIGAPPPLAAG